MKKRVLLVEPSFYGVEFVRSAKELGCEVICLVEAATDPEKYGYQDLFDDLIITDVRSVTAILTSIQESPYSHFAALIPCTDYVTAVTAAVAQSLGVFGTPLVAAQAARNKDLARQIYQEKGVSSAAFQKVTTLNNAKAAANRIGYPLVLKPTNTASSIAVFYIRTAAELARRFQTITRLKTSYLGFQVRHEYLLEEFLQGPEFSVELFLQQGQIAFAEVTEKKTTQPPFFVETMHIFPTTILKEQRSKIIQTAFAAVSALGFQAGPTHVEVKVTATGPRIVEVNGRPGGDSITSDLVYDAYGINIFTETIKLYLGLALTLKPSKRQAAATGFIFATKAGIFEKIENLPLLENNALIKRYVIETKVGTKVKIPENSDDRLGYFIVNADTSIAAKRLASNLQAKLKVVVRSIR
ncbi:hypothetical protein AYR54_04445 [Loigolactobacillus backii]|uniref:ATP-grasp domain-containing protein n=1 Tax=Loigolactobacillus backii TaxID=375175 RepID=UPI0007F09F9D|nr:ATP-grasp domain-containing protein [Loigolactobacillus backii]ANK59560.1 hypothetical protein AYR52_04430 [Loigolactobacillus backii]ANK64555.1 hypothetical protein AYR54_04445 [Loigolactobacillus backii]ANK67051.1 hypothetical protein AYR55_04595 [Loigolactobacillus backii]OLF70703.1 hypothetical protein ACX53_01105 [Loigolactobacillus backii]PIO87696.1 hypothetical protein B8A32_11355 [Loigolactobacillus backii]